MSDDKPRIGLCLPGGGLSGALYQVGALAALEDTVQGLDGQGYSLVIGHSSGAAVATAVAAGISAQRLYRALLDPVDNFFPLHRHHVMRFDLDEWGRTIETGVGALWQALARLRTREPRTDAPSHRALLEQLDRLFDSLPAGIFSLDRYERLLAQVFARRGVPNTFSALPRLRIAAHALDSGERVLFGSQGYRDVPVSLACAASLALPVFYSPVRIGDAHYIDGGLGHVGHIDVAEDAGVDLLVIVSPLVPVATARRGVPTGHGVRDSVRDKGLLWVFNQAMRIGAHTRLRQDLELARAAGKVQTLVLEPEPNDALLFLHNPANAGARRSILEYAYRTTRARMADWIERHRSVAERAGWSVVSGG